MKAGVFLLYFLLGLGASMLTDVDVGSIPLPCRCRGRWSLVDYTPKAYKIAVDPACESKGASPGAETPFLFLSRMVDRVLLAAYARRV
jgi:hypothetical protein